MHAILKKAALASMVAIPLAIAQPAASALAATETPAAHTAHAAPAVDPVPCGDPTFLQIWGNHFHDCFANSGSYSMGGAWVSQISTGNNSITYHDCNGDNVDIAPNNDVSFTNTVCMDSFIIH